MIDSLTLETESDLGVSSEMDLECFSVRMTELTGPKSLQVSPFAATNLIEDIHGNARFRAATILLVTTEGGEAEDPFSGGALGDGGSEVVFTFLVLNPPDSESFGLVTGDSSDLGSEGLLWSQEL